MIEYQLKDSAGNTFPLNGSLVTAQLKDTWTQGVDEYSFYNKTVARSYLPGSIKIGDSRIEARDFILTVDIADNSLSGYRDTVNNLLAALHRTKYLVDVTNSMQIEIAVKNCQIAYETGSLKHLSSNEISCIALTPYWESLDKTEITGVASADTIKEISVNNEGYLKTPFILELTTTAPVNSVHAYLSSNNYGIKIEDALFGTAGNPTMVINNNTGAVMISTLNRNASIIQGTGFLLLDVGTDVLNLLCADADVNYTISFYKRYYL